MAGVNGIGSGRNGIKLTCDREENSLDFVYIEYQSGVPGERRKIIVGCVKYLRNYCRENLRGRRAGVIRAKRIPERLSKMGRHVCICRGGGACVVWSEFWPSGF